MSKFKEFISKNKIAVIAVGVILIAAVVIVLVLNLNKKGSESGDDPSTEDNSSTNGTSQEEESSTSLVESKEASVTVRSKGGLVFEGVSVYIYEDDTKAELVDVKRTDADGKMTFKTEGRSEYVAVLEDVPDGYDVKSSYEITGVNTVIELETKLVESEDISKENLAAGDIMKDFTVMAPDGEEYKLSEIIKDKDAVVLNFWYLTCEPCREEFPYLQEAYEKYGDDIAVLAMNPVNSDDDEIAEYADEMKLTFPVVHCDKGFADAFGIKSYPMTVVIDRYGMISFIMDGAADSAKMFESIFEYYKDDKYVQKVVKDMNTIMEGPGEEETTEDATTGDGETEDETIDEDGTTEDGTTEKDTDEDKTTSGNSNDGTSGSNGSTGTTKPNNGGSTGTTKPNNGGSTGTTKPNNGGSTETTKPNNPTVPTEPSQEIETTTLKKTQDYLGTMRYEVYVGSNYVPIEKEGGEDDCFVVFHPAQSGTYKVEVSGNGTVLTEYSPYLEFFVMTENTSNNVITLNVKDSNLGSKYVFGLTGANSCTVTITRTGDAVLGIEDYPYTDYVGKHTPKKYTYKGSGNLTYFDVSAASGLKASDVVLGSDGYYHYGSKTGPVIYVDFKNSALSMYEMVIGEGNVGGVGLNAWIYDDNGNFIKKEDYTSCLKTYISCADSKTNLYPLTEDLKYILQTGGNANGWYNGPSKQPIFGSKVININTAWLFLCCYDN